MMMMTFKPSVIRMVIGSVKNTSVLARLVVWKNNLFVLYVILCRYHNCLQVWETQTTQISATLESSWITGLKSLVQNVFIQLAGPTMQPGIESCSCTQLILHNVIFEVSPEFVPLSL